MPSYNAYPSGAEVTCGVSLESNEPWQLEVWYWPWLQLLNCPDGLVDCQALILAVMAPLLRCWKFSLYWFWWHCPHVWVPPCKGQSASLSRRALPWVAEFLNCVCLVGVFWKLSCHPVDRKFLIVPWTFPWSFLDGVGPFVAPDGACMFSDSWWCWYGWFALSSQSSFSTLWASRGKRSSSVPGERNNHFELLEGTELL